MSKKTKKATSKHATYKVEYTKEEVKDVVKRINATINNRQNLIDLITIKKRAKMDLLNAEINVMNFCIVDWQKTVSACKNEIKRLKAKAK